jgi:SAM-dependent methyltransferase
MTYDRESYWSGVANRIGGRATDCALAGDADAFYRYKRRKMLSTFLSALPVDGRVVLELGPGPGGNLEWLLDHRRPTRAIGVDISDAMLGLARERLKDRAELHKTDGVSLPLPDRSIDTSFTVTVLQHNVVDSQVHRLASELARVCRGPIVLIEDTGHGQPKADADTAWISRPITEYEAMMRDVGYRLTKSARLGLRVSRAGYNRLIRCFRPLEEGALQPAARRIAIAMWVGIAAPLDSLVPDPIDLTQMVFERR